MQAKLCEKELFKVAFESQIGKDGVSPTATVEQVEDGAVITITDASGTTTAKIANGVNGADGKDGRDGRDGVDGQNGRDGVEEDD